MVLDKRMVGCLEWIRVSWASDWGEGGSNPEGETAHFARFVQLDRRPPHKLLRHSAVESGWHKSAPSQHH